MPWIKIEIIWLGLSYFNFWQLITLYIAQKKGLIQKYQTYASYMNYIIYFNTN